MKSLVVKIEDMVKDEKGIRKYPKEKLQEAGFDLSKNVDASYNATRREILFTQGEVASLFTAGELKVIKDCLEYYDHKFGDDQGVKDLLDKIENYL